MNQNMKQRLKELIKKEGFYIALFLCLCIIVTLGTISYKILSRNDDNEAKDNLNSEVTLNVDEEENNDIATTEMPNAERVENSVESSNATENDTETTNDKKSTIVSSTTVVKFMNPVEGIESRTYTYPNPVQIEENLFRTIRGVNIESKIGTDVKAAAQGVVSLAENSGVEEGIVVEIKHPNGLKTRYGNLDKNIVVKEGQQVNAGQVIGKVGNTSKVFDEEKFGQFLNLQVIDSNGNQVNPEKYFELTSK